MPCVIVASTCGPAGGVARAGGAPANADWQRELQAASKLAWFHGALGPGAAFHAPEPAPPRTMAGAAGDPPPRSGGDEAAATVATGQPGASASATAPAIAAIGNASPVGASIRTAGIPHLALPSAPGNGGAAVATWIAAPLSAHTSPAVRDGVARHLGASSPGPSNGRQPEPMRPVVRLHAEAGSQGVAVWLGIDGDVSTRATRAASLVAALRRLLAASGQELASVVCNGSAIYDATNESRSVDAPPAPREPSPQESSWPSAQ